MLNSERFLSTFNAIAKHLVDLAGQSDAVVRRFSTDLKEFADLRNAIVHERTDGHVLGEPNDQAVQKIESIFQLLTDPPKIIPFFQSAVYALSVGDPIAVAVKTMLEESFSQVPVYDGTTFVGLLTSNPLPGGLGQVLKKTYSSCLERLFLMSLITLRTGTIIASWDGLRRYSRCWSASGNLRARARH
jgi:hypothetical protein